MNKILDAGEILCEQRSRLGTVPISSDFLTKANIGLWAVELDEGKEPRVFVDSVLMNLLELDESYTPEEAYCAWHDLIDAPSNELIDKAIERMMSEHVEIQYPIRRSNGHILMVRCDGVRNQEYTNGIRIEGTLQDVSDVIRFDEAEYKKNKLRQMELDHHLFRSEIISYFADFEGNPLTVIKKFAEKLRTLIGCDQIIYRNTEEILVCVNSPENVGLLPQTDRFCPHCINYVKHDALSSDGITEIYECHSDMYMAPNFTGCNVKSSFSRKMLLEGEPNGCLSFYYFHENHVFTELECETIERFAKVLTISVSRYNAKMINDLLQEERKQEYKHIVLRADALSYAMNEDVTLESFIDFFSDRILEVFGCDQVIYSDINGFRTVKVKEGISDVSMNCANCRLGNPNDSNVYRNSQVIINDHLKDEEGSLMNACCPVKSMISDVVYFKGKPMGCISSHYINSYHEYTDSEIRTCKMIAKLFGMILERISDREFKNMLQLEKEREQKQLATFNDLLHAGMWRIIIDSFNEIQSVFWSPQMKKVLGFEDAYDFPNTLEAWSSRIHPDDRGHVLEVFWNGIDQNDMDYTYETDYRIRKKNDEYIWCHDSGKFEENKDGTRMFYGIITDITAEKKNAEYQEQLKQALDMAQSASRAKTTFLNNMSHDIRTPMNAIIGFTGLAASHIDNKEQVQDYLTKIGQSSDHLLSLINDVLDMSRIESGKMNLEERDENLSDIIHNLRDIVQADIHSKQLDFFIDSVDVENEDVVCDKLRLNQVLLNVLSNAIKYTPAGGTVSLRISEKKVRESGYGSYQFMVKDNGIGMNQEFVKNIFDPFTRVRSSTVSGIQGTGLGMAITKNIVDMMGGTIDINSKENAGTEVYINLDFKLQTHAKEPVVISHLEGIRGLVADDDVNVCMSVSKMLRDIGMRPEWCVSGKEAVLRTEEALRIGDSFKVYILDWLMPDMNGIETARRIRKAVGPDTPIIILTAYDWSDIEDEAREAGVTGFINKPLFPSDLHRILSKMCGEDDSEEDTATKNYDFSGRKILLVEDNDLNLEIAEELLLEAGFIVDTANDGTVAVEKMKNSSEGDYDIILMDVQMPVMDGYEATKCIRELDGKWTSRIPIIAMTANAFEEDRKQALEAGMNEHIAKPINVNTLKEMLARFL